MSFVVIFGTLSFPIRKIAAMSIEILRAAACRQIAMTRRACYSLTTRRPGPSHDPLQSLGRDPACSRPSIRRTPMHTGH